VLIIIIIYNTAKKVRNSTMGPKKDRRPTVPRIGIRSLTAFLYHSLTDKQFAMSEFS
jgi:hypothetical protein